MCDDPSNFVLQASQQSELARAAASVRADGGIEMALGRTPVRHLRPVEIAELERLGNSCSDWSRIRVAEEFDPRALRFSHFQGDVVLGRFERLLSLPSGAELPAGICHSTLVDCVVGHNALVHHVKLLARYVVGPEAILLDCGSLTCAPGTNFGNGTRIPLGIESGGREVAIFAELTVSLAARIACARGDRELQEAYSRALKQYVEAVTADRGIIERGALVCDTPKVCNSYLGRGARIDGATHVSDCTLLSTAEEPTSIESGACVSSTLLQWGSRVTTMAVIERSVLVEHAHAECHGKVTDSILGPNTGVAAGEVTCSLLGPFVGFHHQALLIATLWPEGKGNVSYGANAGSNHTSKAPDQEFRPGEGTFLGLGVNVKFPADFTEAPYTILACGVTTLPQKLCFPFSLINVPSGFFPGISTAYNEIAPAWLLTDNLFALKRNEGKYRARNRARRSKLEYEIFRPAIVELMRAACRRLEAVPKRRDVYTEHDIEGLGKNYLLDKHRLRAIEGYRFFIRYYALLGLKRALEKLQREDRLREAGGILAEPGDDAGWEHCRRILAEVGSAAIRKELSLLSDMAERIAREVEHSKARDDERGRRIIDDYEEVHLPAAEDPFVRQTWDETRRLQADVNELVRALPKAAARASKKKKRSA